MTLQRLLTKFVKIYNSIGITMLVARKAVFYRINNNLISLSITINKKLSYIRTLLTTSANSSALSAGRGMSRHIAETVSVLSDLFKKIVIRIKDSIGTPKITSAVKAISQVGNIEYLSGSKNAKIIDTGVPVANEILRAPSSVIPDAENTGTPIISNKGDSE